MLNAYITRESRAHRHKLRGVHINTHNLRYITKTLSVPRWLLAMHVSENDEEGVAMMGDKFRRFSCYFFRQNRRENCKDLIGLFCQHFPAF